MRVRGLAAAVALLALALAMTGCTKPAPEITDEQLADWRALAADTIPAATTIEIRGDQVTTMGGSSGIVYITVNFATFADLKTSDPAVAALDKTVREQAPDAAVSTTVVNEGEAAFEADIATRLVDGVSGLAGAEASSNLTHFPVTTVASLSVTVYLYVKNPAAIDAQWIDTVATITQGAASDAGGQIYSIAVLPAADVDLTLSEAEVEDALLPVGDLPALMNLGAESGCVRTDSWAYDVSNPWAIVYPADAPEGACA